MKVGDYVRTKYGIAKTVKDKDIVLEQNGNKTIYVDKNGIPRENIFAYYVWSNDIIKSSPNIIDLIEVGDYVNGYKVKGKTNDEVIVDYYCYSKELCDGHYLHWHKDYIETIVTKEQFEGMEYKL